MGMWRKLIGVLWKASRSLEINLPLGRRKLHTKAAGLGIARRMLVMTLHKAESTKLGVDVLQGKDMIAMILKKLGNTMASCEEPIVSVTRFGRQCQ
jgi:hypothetical protein